PGVSKRHRRADQRAVATARTLLEVKEERRTTIKSTVAIADKRRRAPLRATHRARLEPTRIRKTHLVGRKLDGPRVIKTLEHLHDPLIQPKRRRKRADAVA